MTLHQVDAPTSEAERRKQLNAVAEDQKWLELDQADEKLRELCKGLTIRSATFDYWVEVGPMTHRQQVDTVRAKILYLSCSDEEGLCISCHMATTCEADAKKAVAKKADAEKADAEKADAEKADAKKADAEKAAAKKADAEKADAEKADAVKLHGSHTISSWYLERVLQPLGAKGDLSMQTFALTNGIRNPGTTKGQTVGMMRRRLQCRACEGEQAKIEELDGTCIESMAHNANTGRWTTPKESSKPGNLYGFLLVNVMRSLAVRLVESAKYWPYFDALRLKTLLVTKRLTPPAGTKVPRLFLYCIPWCGELVIPVTPIENSKPLELLAVNLSNCTARIGCSYGENGTEFLWMVLTPMLVLVSLAEIKDLAVCEVTEVTEVTEGTKDTEGTAGTAGTEGTESTEGTAGTEGTGGTEGTKHTKRTKRTKHPKQLVNLSDAKACSSARDIVFHVANVLLQELDKLVMLTRQVPQDRLKFLREWKDNGFATVWQAHGFFQETAAARDLFNRVFHDGAMDEEKKTVITQVRQMAAGYNVLRECSKRGIISDSKGKLANGGLIAFAELVSPNVTEAMQGVKADTESAEAVGDAVDATGEAVDAMGEAMEEALRQALVAATQSNQDPKKWLQDLVTYCGHFCPVVVRLHEVCRAIQDLLA
jgi:hypothetical protein